MKNSDFLSANIGVVMKRCDDRVPSRRMYPHVECALTSNVHLLVSRQECNAFRGVVTNWLFYWNITNPAEVLRGTPPKVNRIRLLFRFARSPGQSMAFEE